MTASLLVVDDHDLFREQLCLALESRGYTVFPASDGATALKLADRHQPHLALVDVRMPEMDGIDLIRALQEQVRTSQLPVILMTANARREDIALGAQLGIKDFLLKSSFSIEEIVERIENRLHAAVPPPPELPHSLRDPEGSTGNRSIGAVPRRFDHGASSVHRSSATSSSIASTSGSSSGSSSVLSNSEVPDSGFPSKPRFRQLAPRELRALPTPVADIQRLASSNTASLTQVQAVVRRDPVLAERIMSASASIGVRGTSSVESLEDSLRAMGVEHLMRMVASQPVFTREELAGRFGSELGQLWMHGIATAIFSERLAPASERGTAFLQGLFHVLPAMIALQSIGDEWHDIAVSARKEGHCGIDALALAMGKPANLLAESALSNMRLPDSVSTVVLEWHRDRMRRGSKGASDACRRLDAAASLATGCGFAWSDLSSLRPLTGEESRGWNNADALEFDLPALRRHVRTLQKASDLPETADESVLGGLWGAEDILYWRDPRYRGPDPIEQVLVERKAKRLESPEPILENGSAIAVVCAEPGSPWWSALSNSPRRVLIIHTAPAPATIHKGRIQLLQSPVPLYLLQEALGSE